MTGVRLASRLRALEHIAAGRAVACPLCTARPAAPVRFVIRQPDEPPEPPCPRCGDEVLEFTIRIFDGDRGCD